MLKSRRGQLMIISRGGSEDAGIFHPATPAMLVGRGRDVTRRLETRVLCSIKSVEYLSLVFRGRLWAAVDQFWLFGGSFSRRREETSSNRPEKGTKALTFLAGALVFGWPAPPCNMR